MYNRELGKCIPAFYGSKAVYSCSTGDVASGSAINGSVIDRLGLGQPTAGLNALGTRDRPLTAMPFLFGWQVTGSTFVGKNVTVAVKLQHGDSSGGGDMADVTRADGATATAANFYNSTLSTDYQGWTTAPIEVFSNPFFYELSGVKRYVRAVGTVTKFSGATTTEGTDTIRCKMGIYFGEDTYQLPALVTTSSSTST